MSFQEFLNESINDRGLFKAVFVIGPPGSGKSYTLSKLTGNIEPRVINTDIALEFLSKKLSIPATSENWRPVFRDTTKRMTSAKLFSYLDGMLPLFIDGTSNNTSNILQRAGILESLGYDVAMIFVDTDIETAKKRAKERALKINREVDEEFIEKVYKASSVNKEYFKKKFTTFFEIKNNDGELTDEIILNAYRKVQSFYTSPLNNPIGVANIEKIKGENQKYLTPSIVSKEKLENKISTWY